MYLIQTYSKSGRQYLGKRIAYAPAHTRHVGKNFVVTTRDSDGRVFESHYTEREVFGIVGSMTLPTLIERLGGPDEAGAFLRTLKKVLPE